MVRILLLVLVLLVAAAAVVGGTLAAADVLAFDWSTVTPTVAPGDVAVQLP